MKPVPIPGFPPKTQPLASPTSHEGSRTGASHRRGALPGRKPWLQARPMLAFTFSLFFSAARAQDPSEALAYQGSYVPVLFFGAGMDWDGLAGIQGFFEFHRSWQAGFALRAKPANLGFTYDGIPEGGAHIRYVRLSPEESASLANAEFLDLGLEAYAAYDNGGNRMGAAPLVRLQAGKYWTPRSDWPLTLELSVTLGRYLSWRFSDGHYVSGHPAHSDTPDVLSAGFQILWSRVWPVRPR